MDSFVPMNFAKQLGMSRPVLWCTFSSHFHNFLGAEFSQSRQLLKRLEEEGQYN